jgi:hypothetical protein
MLFREMIAVCSKVLPKYIKANRGQNVKFVNAKRDGTQSYRGVLRG